jgi:hypothetical protein
MTTAERRARKKLNHRAAMARKAGEKAEAERVAAEAEAAEQAEIDAFLGPAVAPRVSDA